MTRDTQLKLLTLLFGTISILAIGACTAVGLSETTSNADGEPTVIPTPTEAPAEPTPQATITSTPAPENTPTLTPENTPVPPEDGDTATSEVPEDEASTEEAESQAQPGRPVEIQIDKIGASAPFEWVGMTPEGNMEAPEGWHNAAWYEPGTVPGAQGNAVITGHYDAPGGVAALFYRLRDLAPGDRVTIRTEHDEELIFEVTEVETVHVGEAPLGKIFGDTDQHNLNLITCEGAWDPSAGMYDQRLIVYTTLVSG